MKKLWLIPILGILLLSIAALAGCADGRPHMGSFFSNQNTGISVSGEGKVSAAPDLAVLSLGVQAQANTVSQAQSQANTSMNAVLGALRTAGVADKDIQTSQYSIQQLVNYDKNGQPTVTGYLVVNTVTAKVRAVANTGTIIDAVAQAGGDNTRINGISFNVNDPSSYETQARQLAVADAKAKATQLANQAGVKLGEPFFVSESGGFSPPSPLPVSLAQSAGSATSISPGTNDIIVDVQITFGID